MGNLIGERLLPKMSILGKNKIKSNCCNKNELSYSYTECLHIKNCSYCSDRLTKSPDIYNTNEQKYIEEIFALSEQKS